jgi:hypothetical protein
MFKKHKNKEQQRAVVAGAIAVVALGIGVLFSQGALFTGTFKGFPDFPEFKCDLKTASVATSEVSSEYTSSGTSEVASSVSSEVTSDVASGETSKVTSLVTSEVTSSGGTSLVTSEVTSEVTSGPTSEVTSTVVSLVTSLVPYEYTEVITLFVPQCIPFEKEDSTDKGRPNFNVDDKVKPFNGFNPFGN